MGLPRNASKALRLAVLVSVPAHGQRTAGMRRLSPFETENELRGEWFGGLSRRGKRESDGIRAFTLRVRAARSRNVGGFVSEETAEPHWWQITPDRRAGWQ